LLRCASVARVLARLTAEVSRPRGPHLRFLEGRQLISAHFPGLAIANSRQVTWTSCASCCQCSAITTCLPLKGHPAAIWTSYGCRPGAPTLPGGSTISRLHPSSPAKRHAAGDVDPLEAGLRPRSFTNVMPEILLDRSRSPRRSLYGEEDSRCSPLWRYSLQRSDRATCTSARCQAKLGLVKCPHPVARRKTHVKPGAKGRKTRTCAKMLVSRMMKAQFAFSATIAPRPCAQNVLPASRNFVTST
jgi:hypothetical protein